MFFWLCLWLNGVWPAYGISAAEQDKLPQHVQEKFRIKIEDRVITNIATSRDGELLAVATARPLQDANQVEIELWDLNSGKKKRTFRTADLVSVERLAFSPDGKLLATRSDTLRFFEVATGKELFSLKSGYTFAFHPDGYAVAVDELFRSRDVINFRRPRDGKILREFITNASVYDFSGDGKFLGVVRNKQLEVLNAKTGEVHMTVRVAAVSASVRFSPDGKSLATGGWTRKGPNKLEIWDLPSGKLRCKTNLSCYKMAFSPDGKWLAVAVGGPKLAISVRDAQTANEICSIPTTGATGLAFPRKDMLVHANGIETSFGFLRFR